MYDHRFPYKALGVGKAHSATDWGRRHNLALNHYSAGTASNNETIILDMARAIASLIDWDYDGAMDGYGRPNITIPMVQAFQHRLNYSLDRLDGGTLSAWITDLAATAGLTEVV